MSRLTSSPSISASAADSIADAFGKKILSGLRPGDILPSEAEIAAEFGVSRITIREAMKILSGRGLVSIARGRRAVVAQPDGAMFGSFLTSLIKGDPKNLFDLLQVRRSLEIQSVVLAARHASRTGLTAVDAALSAMRSAAAEIDAGAGGSAAEMAFHLADVRFHSALALSGGNRVLTYLFEAMESSLLEAFATSHRGLRLAGERLADLCDAHAAVSHQVAQRDEKAAVEAMTQLLDNAAVNLRAAIGNA
jgi:GntR family transcriptional regulator, transcriptional repressor for pyruvate dehydrogenase complex